MRMRFCIWSFDIKSVLSRWFFLLFPRRAYCTAHGSGSLAQVDFVLCNWRGTVRPVDIDGGVWGGLLSLPLTVLPSWLPSGQAKEQGHFISLITIPLLRSPPVICLRSTRWRRGGLDRRSATATAVVAIGDAPLLGLRDIKKFPTTAHFQQT